MADDYRVLVFTDDYWASLAGLHPALTADDAEGIANAFDELDENPTALHNRLHRLDRELAGWWSLTPAPPGDQRLRILVRPERIPTGGIWRIGPVTWHYRR
jgi:hypothetical protein